MYFGARHEVEAICFRFHSRPWLHKGVWNPMGHVMEPFHDYVAGIYQLPGSRGRKQILITPDPGALDWVKTGFDSPAGKIISRGTVLNGRFHRDAEMPAGV